MLRAAGVGFFGKAWSELREALRIKEYPRLATRAANAEFVGWYDAQYIYLLSKVAYRVMHKFYRDSGGGVSRYRARGEGKAEGAWAVVSGGE